LLAAGLVDEIRVFTFPVLLGKGKRLFDSTSQAGAYKLAHSKVSPLGLISATYVPNGEVKHETIRGAENPSNAELARRERMKREG
jgi:dihydrofolate reductase